jgi:phosphoglycerol transferase MdoB-like AlkP superfamily enzyme
MKSYWIHIRLLVYRLLIVFSLMSFTRLLFYWMNLGHFNELTFGELIKHLFYGLQFDMSSIFMFNIVFILLSIIPGKLLNNPSYQLILKWLFITVNLILVSLNIIDCKFFEFQEKRLTADIFTREWLGGDFITLLPHFVADYWYLFLLTVGLVMLLIYWYPKFKQQITDYTLNLLFIIRQTLTSILILCIVVICGRGTLQLKPLRIITAASYTTSNNIPLVLNSSFTIIKTINKDKISKPKYFDNNKLDHIYSPVHQYGTSSQFTKKNVVIIILESFGREYSALLNLSDTGYTPCLDSVMLQGLYCTNGYANGKRSIEAMPSVISGIPNLMTDPFITSSFATNDIEGLAKLLKPYGYSTAFFHGGKNGTMGFDNFAYLSGFEKYYGLNEYDQKAGNDGPWGILDEPFLQFMVRKLSEMPEPFATGVFTLSSHHPYFIPEQYIGRFPKGNLINEESIGYADYALGKFFESASKQKWFNNTLFVITADHTAQTAGKFYKTIVGHYAVPIVFYCPSDSLLKGNNNITVQQCDILPTVMDYLKYPDPFIAFGNSVFDTVCPHFAVTYLNGLYQLISDYMSISFDGNKIVDAYTITRDSLVSIDTIRANCPDLIYDEDLLKAVIQQYYTRLIENKLVTGK